MEYIFYRYKDRKKDVEKHLKIDRQKLRKIRQGNIILQDRQKDRWK